jgi:hypothetical protein
VRLRLKLFQLFYLVLEIGLFQRAAQTAQPLYKVQILLAVLDLHEIKKQLTCVFDIRTLVAHRAVEVINRHTLVTLIELSYQFLRRLLPFVKKPHQSLNVFPWGFLDVDRVQWCDVRNNRCLTQEPFFL